MNERSRLRSWALILLLIAAVFVALPLWQVAGIGLTVVFAVVTGLAIGFIVSKVGQKETSYDDKDEFILPKR